MNNSIFETKQQYLAFRAAFAAAQNDKRAKPTLVDLPCSTYNWRTRETHSWMGKQKIKGWLQAEHFILLNAARGKPLNRGFTPATTDRKVASYGNEPAKMFNGSLLLLQRLQWDAQKIVAGVKLETSPFLMRTLANLKPDEMAAELERMRQDAEDKLRKRVSVILEPFAGTLTMEQFAALKLETQE